MTGWIRRWFNRQKDIRFAVKTASELLAENIALLEENKRLRQFLIAVSDASGDLLDGGQVFIQSHKPNVTTMPSGRVKPVPPSPATRPGECNS